MLTNTKNLPLMKKRLLLQINWKLIEKEVQNLEITEEQKNTLQLGIDTVIEPLIELTILTAFKKFNIRNPV